MSREAENFYKMVISNIFVLSYALTYGNQLSPASFWLAVRPFFQERSCVSQAKLFLSFCYSCVFIKWKKYNIYPSILLIHIVDSTFHHLINQMVPLSLQNGKCFASFPSRQHTRLYFPRGGLLWPSADYQMVQTSDRKPAGLPLILQRENISMLSFNKRMFHIPPAKQKALHSLEPKACRLMSLCSYRPANPRRIRTDSKHSLRLFDMSFFLVTRLLNARICLFRTDSEQSSRPFVFVLKGKRNGSRSEV